ncbi:MAG TPA: TonB-dependent receptor, partial [Myxococcaceae bacterium]|nr:TonB-dependent receptor [Myxococcaceae bacterium]
MSGSSHPPFRGARAVLATLLVGWTLSAHAANLGIVHGTVHDENGQPIPRTRVTLLRGNQQLDAHSTDASGHFEFEQVPFGKYRLTFAAPDGRMDDREILIASGDVLEQDVTLPTLEETVTVVAPQREAPRPTTTTGSAEQIQREDIQSRPRGDSATVNEILATQPGFVYDALGQIYVRGNHANIQYQLDGVQLPDTVSGLFGQFLTPRLVENMEVITGGLPAEYGQRLSAVVNLNSRQPPTGGEGRFDLTYGSFGTVSPGAYWGQKVGAVSYLVGGSFNWTQRGLDPPNPTTYLNDAAQQGRIFAKVDLDLNDRDHLSTLFSYSHDRFQIPIDPTIDPNNMQGDQYGNPPPPYFPPDTQQTETENDVFGILSYRHDFDAARSLRIAGYARHSAAKFFGDPEQALVPPQRPCPEGTTPDTRLDQCPGASNVDRRADHVGVVSDYLQRIGDQHTLKFGLNLDQLWGQTAYDTYAREITPPPEFSRVGQGADQPTATAGGIYAQDRWTVGKLTITGGLRGDFQSASPGAGSNQVTDFGVSPRLGAAWAFTPDVVAHAFFGLLWIPPSVTDAAAGARLKAAVPPGEPIPYDLRPEKDRYAEVGLRGRVYRALTLGLTLWGRLSTDQLDETEVGNTGITTPYNFAEGRAGGIEATADWVLTQKLTAFGNVTFGTAQGKG